jgi:hypothetical protein
MRALMMRKIANSLGAAALATALACAPGPAAAMDGESVDGGAHGPTPIHGSQGAQGYDHFHDGRPHDARFYDGRFNNQAIPRGQQPYDSAYADHRWLGPAFDAARRGWPADWLFGAHRYGDHDTQFCTRRDVYGDLYQAC